jgi:hypothetical protein
VDPLKLAALVHSATARHVTVSVGSGQLATGNIETFL